MERKKRVKKKKESTVTPSLLVFQFSQCPRLSQLNTNNTNNAVIYLSSSRFSGLHLRISNLSRTRFGSVTHPVGKYEATRLITDLCVFSRGVCGLILARHLTINMWTRSFFCSGSFSVTSCFHLHAWTVSVSVLSVQSFSCCPLGTKTTQNSSWHSDKSDISSSPAVGSRAGHANELDKPGGKCQSCQYTEQKLS